MKIPRVTGAAAVAGTLVVAVSLAGCSTSSDFEIFDRAATESDALPYAATVDPAMFDMDALRYSGSHNDVDFYVVRDAEGNPCLGIFPDPAVHGNGGDAETTSASATAERDDAVEESADGGAWSIVCGGPSGVEGRSGNDYSARLTASTEVVPEGWIAISDNVLVEENPAQ